MGTRLQWNPKITRHIQNAPTMVQPSTEPITGRPNRAEKIRDRRLVISVAMGPMTK